MFKSITDNGYNGFYQVVEFCLEDSTERSESNPGRSLGIITKEKRAVWKTVPCRFAPSPSAQCARAQKVHG